MTDEILGGIKVLVAVVFVVFGLIMGSDFVEGWWKIAAPIGIVVGVVTGVIVVIIGLAVNKEEDTDKKKGTK